MMAIKSKRLGILILLALLAVVSVPVNACRNQAPEPEESDICALPTDDPTQAGCRQYIHLKDFPNPYPKTVPLTPEESFDLMQNEANLVIIDVRSPSEFAAGHIAGAVNIDYYSEDFQDQINSLDPAGTYLTYSQNEGYSANTANMLDGLITSEAVYFISGGLKSWIDLGFPITK